MWYMVAQRLTQITPPNATPDQLWQCVEATWSAVSQEHIQSFFESMPRHGAEDWVEEQNDDFNLFSRPLQFLYLNPTEYLKGEANGAIRILYPQTSNLTLLESVVLSSTVSDFRKDLSTSQRSYVKKCQDCIKRKS
ncbi:hypothetical protein TNCV_4291131 [Trichonephila clavipes]|nr:hypothetical protein TNCV_4291131 [Trichonephila clavipes]